MSLFDLSSIEAAFMRAAVEPYLWRNAMDVVTSAFGGYGAGLFPIDGQFPGQPRTETLEPSFQSYFQNGWVERDLRYRGISIARRYGAYTDFDYISHEEMGRQPYYQEFLRPNGLKWFAGIGLDSPGDFWVLSIQRRGEQDPFTRAQVAEMAQLAKRLSSALSIASAFAFTRAHAAAHAFQYAGKAAILLDRRGQVVLMNELAHKLCDGDLQIISKRLTSIDVNATRALNYALHRLLWTKETALSEAVVLPRQNRRPIIAYIGRLESSIDGILDCQAIVSLHDLDARPKANLDVLRHAFKLTHAEARFAQAIGAGGTLQDAADSVSITRETARSRVKVIFAKTGARRQSELVSLLHRLPFSE